MTADAGPFIGTRDIPFVRFDGLITMNIQQQLNSHCAIDVFKGIVL